MVGVRDDESAGVLPENLVEPSKGDVAGLYEVAKDVSRADARQLVRVADEYYRCRRGNRREQLVCKLDVYHRRFVEDEDISFERIFLVERELVRHGIPL